METTYLYSVNPKKIIKDLPTLPIRSPRSLYLTKEQVLICLKSGTVYRRFATENRNERVTILNLDRLHNDKFMTEEEYKTFLESKTNDQRGTIINDHKEDKKETVNEDVIKEEENNNDESHTVQSDANVGDNGDEVVEEATEEESADETETTTEEPEVNTTNNNNQNNRNKKYNKRNRK